MSNPSSDKSFLISYLVHCDVRDLEVLLEPLLDGLLELLGVPVGVVALHPLGRDADVALLPAHVVLVLQLGQEVSLVHLQLINLSIKPGH